MNCPVHFVAPTCQFLFDFRAPTAQTRATAYPGICSEGQMRLHTSDWRRRRELTLNQELVGVALARELSVHLARHDASERIGEGHCSRVGSRLYGKS